MTPAQLLHSIVHIGHTCMNQVEIGVFELGGKICIDIPDLYKYSCSILVLIWCLEHPIPACICYLYLYGCDTNPQLLYYIVYIGHICMNQVEIGVLEFS